jgi:hypothetical protein
LVAVQIPGKIKNMQLIMFSEFVVVWVSN